MTSKKLKIANPTRDSKGRFISKKSKGLFPTVIGDDLDDDDLTDELPPEILSEVNAIDKVMKSEIQTTDEVENQYEEKEIEEDSDEDEDVITETKVETKVLNSVELEERRISKAIGNKEKTECPVDKSVSHPHPALNTLKMKIGVKPGIDKGKYAKNELGFLIGDVIYRNGYKDVKNELERERCWKQIMAEGIECSKTQFKERWVSTFKLLA